jgi:predicted acylesterase/phospholipase RssA
MGIVRSLLNASRYDTKSKNRFQILALSGGGFRGQYTATVLAELEQVTRQPLARSFDLIVGTSVGGILALGLALEIPAKKLAELFSLHGDAIFWPQRSLWGFWRARYSTQQLRKLLAKPDMFGDRLLGECRHRLVIPTINYSTGQPVMLKTPHHQNFRTDHLWPVVDVALATSAAPFYFARHRMNHNQYIDGGLCANAPGLLGVHEAEIFLGQSIEDIRLLAIGSMTSAFTVNPEGNCLGGILDWGRGSPAGAAQRLFSITISAQESLAHYMLRHRLREERFALLDDVLTPDRAQAVALDKTDAAAREVLIGTAKERAKHALGTPKVQEILKHQAASARFFHGVRANDASEV